MGADPRRSKRNATLSGYGPQRCSHRSGCSVGADPRRPPKITQDADLGHVVLLGAGLHALLCKFSHLHALPSIKREQDESGGRRRGEDLRRGVVALRADVCTQVPNAV